MARNGLMRSRLRAIARFVRIRYRRFIRAQSLACHAERAELYGVVVPGDLVGWSIAHEIRREREVANS